MFGHLRPLPGVFLFFLIIQNSVWKNNPSLYIQFQNSSNSNGPTLYITLGRFLTSRISTSQSFSARHDSPTSRLELGSSSAAWTSTKWPRICSLVTFSRRFCCVSCCWFVFFVWYFLEGASVHLFVIWVGFEEHCTVCFSQLLDMCSAVILHGLWKCPGHFLKLLATLKGVR